MTRGGGLAAVGACDVWSVGGYSADGVNHTRTERLLQSPRTSARMSVRTWASSSGLRPRIR